MGQKIIGLDLGSYRVKAIMMESAFRGVSITGLFSAPVPQDPPEEERPLLERQIEALTELRAAIGPNVKLDSVYTAIPGSEATSHVLTLPFTDLRKIEQTLPFELEDHIPFDVEDVVFDHITLRREENKSEILVGVIRRKSFERLLEALTEAGFDPRTVSLPSLPYLNLYAQGMLRSESAGEGPLPPEALRAEAVLDIGHRATDLLVVEDGEVRSSRSFPVAGRALTMALAAGEGIELAEAEELKVRRGSLLAAPDDTEAQRLADHLQRGLAPLVRALRQSFFAHSARSKRKIDRIHLTGGTARLTGLARHLSRELGCEVVPLDPFPAEGVTVEATRERGDEEVSGLGVALALRAQTGTRGDRSNLRTGEFHFRGDLSYLRAGVPRLALLGIVLLALLGVNVYARFYTLSIQEEQVDQAMCELTQKVLGNCYTHADDALSRLKGATVGGGAVPVVSAAEILSEVAQRLEKMEEVELAELDISATKVRLNGEAGTFDAVAKVVSTLQDYDCFGEVSQGQTRQAKKSDKIEFNVDATLTEECSS